MTRDLEFDIEFLQAGRPRAGIVDEGAVGWLRSATLIEKNLNSNDGAIQHRLRDKILSFPHRRSINAMK